VAWMAADERLVCLKCRKCEPAAVCPIGATASLVVTQSEPNQRVDLRRVRGDSSS
jgi:hypothetical protein